MERLFYYPTQAATYPPPHLSGAESVTFQSGDGTKLHGWFIPAYNVSSPSEAPTILHVHGNAGNIESHVQDGGRFFWRRDVVGWDEPSVQVRAIAGLECDRLRR